MPTYRGRSQRRTVITQQAQKVRQRTTTRTRLFHSGCTTFIYIMYRASARSLQMSMNGVPGESRQSFFDFFRIALLRCSNGTNPRQHLKVFSTMCACAMCDLVLLQGRGRTGEVPVTSSCYLDVSSQLMVAPAVVGSRQCFRSH